MNDTDLAFASIEEIGKLFRKRKISPVELTKLMLARIEQLNPKLNAYITVTAELALAQAKKAESELFAPRGRKGKGERCAWRRRRGVDGKRVQPGVRPGSGEDAAGGAGEGNVGGGGSDGGGAGAGVE